MVDYIWMSSTICMRLTKRAVAVHDTMGVIEMSSQQRFPFQAALNTSTLQPFKLSVPEQVHVAAAAGFAGIELWVNDMPELQLVRRDHAPALLAFEWENRAYFAASIPDRGDAFFAEFDTRHAQLLAEQAAGTGYFHLLVAEGGAVVGRVNLFDVADGSAELGYRIAQQVAGQGLATAAVRMVRDRAATAYGLTTLRARVTLDNPASRKVLEHNGFVAGGSLTLNGKPAIAYSCALR
jgi:ribosomal-protein-alanine N-acetyltransferase